MLMSPALPLPPYWPDMPCSTLFILCPCCCFCSEHVPLPPSHVISWQRLKPPLPAGCCQSILCPRPWTVNLLSTRWHQTQSSGVWCLHRKSMSLCLQFLARCLTQRRYLKYVGWMDEWTHESVFQNLFLELSSKVENALPVGCLKACRLFKS